MTPWALGRQTMQEPSTSKVRSGVTPTRAIDTGHSQIEYKNVRRHFIDGERDFVAVDGIDLTVRRGEFVCIIGPSGCGKSTLLNMAAGLLLPTEGTVLYDGLPIRGINTSVGYVTQRDCLLPWRTAERNVALPLELQGVPSRERKQKVREVLDLVGLNDRGNLYPSQLSGGMLKRTALAQILIYEPTTLLMDEPFGALDAQLRMSLQRDLLKIWERTGKTVLFVTHDLEEAILMGDRVVVFGANPGRIIHIEDIPLERPRDLVALRADPRFTNMWERLWLLLAPQIEEST
jgi:NitT/TauT family transport system ATP-binding protein